MSVLVEFLLVLTCIHVSFMHLIFFVLFFVFVPFSFMDTDLLW